MAVIEKIRQRSGLVIGIIGLALLSFLISDAVSNNINVFNSTENTVGEIDGDDIDYNEYVIRVQKLSDQVEQQQGMALDEAYKGMIRDQVWNELIQEKVINEEYKELGIQVTDEELLAIISNPVDFPQLMNEKAFQNEQGLYESSKLLAYLKQIEDDPQYADAYAQWVNFEQTNIKPQVMQKKYNTLISKSIYRTKLELEDGNLATNKTVEAKIVGQSYMSIPDTTIQVSDEEMEKYLKEHPEDYKQEASRKVEYLVFDIKPSAEDTAIVKKWADDMVGKFRTTTNDTLFVENNSDNRFDTTFKPRGSFPKDVDAQIFSSEPGTVIGPNYESGSYSLYKVLAFKTDTVSYVNLSQILIRPTGFTKEDSLATIGRGNAIAASIRKGASFETLAKDSSQDYSSRSNGGSMGWVKEKSGRIPEAVESRALSGSKGDIFVVRTSMGVHIVRIDEVKTNRTAAVAVVNSRIEFTNETEKAVYKQASQFLLETTEGANFGTNAEKAGMVPRISPDLKEGEKSLPGIENAREIVRWTFSDEVKPGDISQPFVIENVIVIAHLVSVKEEGVAKVEDVKEKLKADVIQYKKAQQIKDKLLKAKGEGKAIEQIAGDLGTVVNNAPNQQFGNPNLPYIGNDAPLVGAMFGLPEQQISDPVKGATGVYVIYVVSSKVNEVPMNPSEDRKRLTAEASQNAPSRAFEALKTSANIKDYRYKYF